MPPHSEIVQDHFNRLAATGGWEHLYAIEDGRTYHFHVRRTRVLELLPDRLGRVVDIGCGPGVMAEAVLARGGTFDGVDHSPEMVREGIRRVGRLPGVRVLEGNIEALDLPSQAYDQVICMAVLEYLDRSDRAFAEIARMLRPGGCAIVTVPKRWHIDRLTVAATAPLRALGRALGQGTWDGFSHQSWQPAELDASARHAGLIPDGGSQYHFTVLPYPLTRVAPTWSMRINRRFERWHATRSPLASFFAHGYVGRYRKPGQS